MIVCKHPKNNPSPVCGSDWGPIGSSFFSRKNHPPPGVRLDYNAAVFIW